MTRHKILQADESYSFRSYFDFPYEIDDILAEFGYGFAANDLILPERSPLPLEVNRLQAELKHTLKLTRLSTETARREVLVGPVLFAVARWCECQIRVEYPLQVNAWLKGTLDYLLFAQQALLVIEAKRDDLARGFTQLAVEMIALAEERNLAYVYGAVTLGDVWRFGKLDRDRHMITQDLALYPVPADLPKVMGILGGILADLD